MHFRVYPHPVTQVRGCAAVRWLSSRSRLCASGAAGQDAARGRQGRTTVPWDVWYVPWALDQTLCWPTLQADDPIMSLLSPLPCPADPQVSKGQSLGALVGPASTNLLSTYLLLPKCLRDDCIPWSAAPMADHCPVGHPCQSIVHRHGAVQARGDQEGPAARDPWGCGGTRRRHTAPSSHGQGTVGTCTLIAYAAGWSVGPHRW